MKRAEGSATAVSQMADEKLSLSLDDIISKNKKPDPPAKAAAGGKGPRKPAAKADGPGPAGGKKARALAVAVGKATKRTGAAPRRNSGGAPRRQVEVVELAEVTVVVTFARQGDICIVVAPACRARPSDVGTS